MNGVYVCVVCFLFVLFAYVHVADPDEVVDDVDVCEEVEEEDDDDEDEVDGSGAVADVTPFGRIIIVAFFNV